MGNCLVSAENAENLKIQAEQRKAELASSQIVKLLIVGAGSSGKTAIRKQLQVLYGEGFPTAMRKQIASVIVSNLIEGMKDVLNALPMLQIELPNDLALAAHAVQALETSPRFLGPDLVVALRALISSAEVKSAVLQRAKFQLEDCWLTFSQELVVGSNAQWGTENWIPNTEEVVAARVKTSGIIEQKLRIQNVSFHIYDVGGQRAERRKWIHSFEAVTSVLFVAAISEYDQVLYEDRSKNRLEESLELFDEICNSRWFASVPTILFLNKRDLFEKKYVEQRVPLNISGCFPTAPTGEDAATLPAALEWVTQEFLAKRKSPNKQVYAHVTTATDATNVKMVFEVCQKIIIKSNLEKAGLIGME